MTARKIGDFTQGEDESIVYSVTTTEWGSTPTAVAVVAYDVTGDARTNVSTTVLTGAATVLGDVITLPALASLTVDHEYRVEVKFTAGGNTWEPYLIVIGEH